MPCILWWLSDCAHYIGLLINHTSKREKALLVFQASSGLICDLISLFFVCPIEGSQIVGFRL